MKNKDFDQFIKQSLENVDGSEYIPMDWSLMDDKLGMDHLDDLVKESLEGLEGQVYAPMNWALMTDKLDAELGIDASLDAQMEDIHLDAVAYSHLENLNAPYNKEHWKIMEARLDEEYAYRKKVLFTKIMEAAVVLLLVWTAINFFPNKKITTSHKETPVANSNQNNTNSFNEVYVPNQLISENIISSESSTISKVEKNTKGNVDETLLASNGEDDFNPIAFTNIPPTENILIKEVASLGEQVSSFVQSQNESSSSYPIEEEVMDNELVKKDDILTAVYPLSSLVSSALLYRNYKKDLTTYSGFLKKRKIRTHDFFFSMFSSADFNYIQSDFYNIKIREDDVYARGQKGYGGGFSLGFQLKKLLIETGVVYNFIRYDQREEAEIIGNFADGYVKEKWQGAELNMLQVPLNIQYSFLLKRKWRMYSLTGVSLNMALQNNFDYQLDIDNQNTASRSPTPIKERSKIAIQAAESQGFFEGGSFRENSYLTANLGFGLERKFTYRWSLYFQPVYQHHFLFEGIGPNKDRINSGSLRLGAKVKIW